MGDRNCAAAQAVSVADDEPGDAEPPPSDARLVVELVGLETEWKEIPGLAAGIEQAVSALGRHARLADRVPAEACVALSSDAEVGELNRAWRGKDKPTNVLSFPSTVPPGSDVGETAFLGDVILARETVLAEAHDLRIPVLDHVLHLVIHGVLHLCGFDHETDDLAEDMEALETEILASIGVPDPYAAA